MVNSLFSIHIPEPKTLVIGGPDLYLDAGSTLNLTCVVKFSPEPPPYIFWYHEDKVRTITNLITITDFGFPRKVFQLI